MKYGIMAWDLDWCRRSFLSDLPALLLKLAFNAKVAAILQAKAIEESKPWALPGLPYWKDGKVFVDSNLVVLA